MTLADIQKLFDRISRILPSLEKKDGAGFSWESTWDNGDVTVYELTNVRSLDELGDDFSNLANWIWSLKDYIKKYCDIHGIPGERVEEFINQDSYLPLCADLANFFKHGSLNRSCSGLWPTKMTPSYSIKMNRREQIFPLSGMKFGGNSVKFDIADPKLIEVKFEIKEKDDRPFPEGLNLLYQGITSWESFLSANNIAISI